MEIEGLAFPPALVPPGSSKSLLLGGAGFRGMEINGNFIKFTAIGIYIEEGVIKHLSPKLKGKTAEELCKDELLFEELLQAPHEKFVRVVFLLPLTGVQYSEKVLERIEAQARYTNVQEKHRQQFLEVFKAESFPPRSSVLLSFSQEGLKIAFSKDNDVPLQPVSVIEDATFGEAVLATIIWKEGVSPGAKVSLAERLSNCF